MELKLLTFMLINSFTDVLIVLYGIETLHGDGYEKKHRVLIVLYGIETVAGNR